MKGWSPMLFIRSYIRPAVKITPRPAVEITPRPAVKITPRPAVKIIPGPSAPKWHPKVVQKVTKKWSKK